jgi:hypothetical protein
LANLGHSIGDSFRIISMGSEQGGEALADLTSAIGYTVKAVSTLILGFELAYGAIKDGAHDAKESLDGFLGVGASAAVDNFVGGLFHIKETTISAGKALGDLDGPTRGAAGGLGEVAANAAKAAIATLSLNDALDANRNMLLAMADANIGVAQGWLDLKEELADGAKTLDLTTQAGIDNANGIKSQIGLLQRQKEQAIETGGNTVDAVNKANAAYDEGIARVRALALSLGFSKEQTDALIASMGAVKPVVTSVTVHGLADSLGQGISLGNALNRIDGATYSAHVAISGMGAALADAARLAATFSRAGQSRDNGYAAGGTVGWSGPKLVGEKGPEVRWLNRGEYISTAAQTQRLVSRMGSGGNGGSGGGSTSGMTMTIASGADSVLGTWLVQQIRSGAVALRDAENRPIKVA